jgi:ribosome biogenesis protein Nip4
MKAQGNFEAYTVDLMTDVVPDYEKIKELAPNLMERFGHESVLAFVFSYKSVRTCAAHKETHKIYPSCNLEMYWLYTVLRDLPIRYVDFLRTMLKRILCVDFGDFSI